MYAADLQNIDTITDYTLWLNQYLLYFSIYQKKKFSHSQVFEPLSAHRAVSAHGVDQVGFEERHILHAVRQHGTHGNLVAIVAVVCVALMAFLLVLGVVRIRYK